MNDRGVSSVLGSFTEKKINGKEDALAAIQDVSAAIGIKSVPETLGDVYEFSSLNSKFYRFQQVYNGIPVYGRGVSVGASVLGDSQGLTHNYIKIEDLNTTPSVSESDAKQVVSQKYGQSMQIISCNLSVYSLFEHIPTLTWQIQVEDASSMDTCFVDAKTGEIIASFSNSYTESVTGTYTDSNGTIDFNTSQNPDGTFSLVDGDRNISVYNANYQTVVFAFVDEAGNVYQYNKEKKQYVDKNGKVVVVQEPNNKQTGVCDIQDESGAVVGRNAAYVPCSGNPLKPINIMQNQSTKWTNKEAATVMSLTADVFDFYQDVFNLSGFNGDNGIVRIAVNDDRSGDPSNASSSRGDTKIFTVLSFGHQIDIDADLIGHEYNHSVEQAKSTLTYSDESGAIMEAYADIFGELFEDWVIDRKLDDDCDWKHGDRNMTDPSLSQHTVCYFDSVGESCPVASKQKEGKHIVGEGVVTPGLFSSGSCIINVPYPEYYQGENYYRGSMDGGGVHTNCTVISHAAYLMTHPESTAVEALTNEDLAQVLYHSLGFLPSDCNFETLASCIYLSADILKLSETKQKCIVEAFKAVGIVTEKAVLVEIPKNIVSSGTCGPNATWTLDDQGTMTISGSGEVQHSWDESWIESASVKTIVFEYGIESIGKNAFARFNNVTRILFSDSVKYIGEQAFACCRGLTTVTIPGSVNTIGEDAFVECHGLTSITILPGVEKIEEGAFCECEKLVSIEIPSSVVTIGKEVVDVNNDSFSDVYYNGTRTQWNAIDIANPNNVLKNATIHFLSNSESGYKVQPEQLIYDDLIAFEDMLNGTSDFWDMVPAFESEKSDWTFFTQDAGMWLSQLYYYHYGRGTEDIYDDPLNKFSEYDFMKVYDLQRVEYILGHMFGIPVGGVAESSSFYIYSDKLYIVNGGIGWHGSYCKYQVSNVKKLENNKHAIQVIASHQDYYEASKVTLYTYTYVAELCTENGESFWRIHKFTKDDTFSSLSGECSLSEADLNKLTERNAGLSS